MGEPAGIRLQKFLSRSGRTSRREAERLLVAGRIRVNGEVVTELGTRVVAGRDTVELDGETVSLPPVRWILFHKPPGVLTTARDPHGGTTVYDVLPEEMSGLRYVGRLDRETEGLLLLTNDGDVAHGLQHPSREVEREYLASVREAPSDAALSRLERGVELEDGPARALAAERADDRGTVRLVLAEGRKREVRRLMEAIGHPVVRLVRVRFGPIRLGDLEVGAWRALSAEETSAVEQAAEIDEN